MPESDDCNLSISHSGNTIVIGQSRISRIGVDVEVYNEKIIRVSDKFLSSREKKTFGQTDLKSLTTIWSAKESFFKMFPDEHLNFAEQIEVLRLDPHPLVQIQHLQGGLQYGFCVLQDENKVITWCMDR